MSDNLEFIFAKQARDMHSVASNSGFKVGAYLETFGPVNYRAGNIEHPNAVLNVCAERMVIMLAKGNKIIPKHMHLVSDNDKPTFPCGVCRQYMTEFPDLKITVYSKDGSKKITKTAKQLLPNPFERDRV